jgi:hypothetical protein
MHSTPSYPTSTSYSPTTPEAAVQLNVDTDGEASLSIRLEDLPAAAERIVITATTNDSQLFGDVSAVGFVLTNDIGTTLATGTSDAGTTEQSMILAELYRRGDTWRVRLVGQGYEAACTNWLSATALPSTLELDPLIERRVQRNVYAGQLACSPQDTATRPGVNAQMLRYARTADGS